MNTRSTQLPVGSQLNGTEGFRVTEKQNWTVSGSCNVYCSKSGEIVSERREKTNFLGEEFQGLARILKGHSFK